MCSALVVLVKQDSVVIEQELVLSKSYFGCVNKPASGLALCWGPRQH